MILGWTFASRYIFPSLEPDRFMKNSARCLQDHTYIFRLLTLAEGLFDIRRAGGLDIMIERLVSRPLQATFFELRAASRLINAGYSVQFHRESLVRGDDFDFRATKGEIVVNVEATALSNTDFSERNILNVLKAKRSQVPEGSPAILFCAIPFDWLLAAGHNLNAPLTSVTERFFRGSGRLSAVAYSWDARMSFGERQLQAVVTHFVENPNARHPIADRAYLEQVDDQADLVRTVVDGGSAAQLQQIRPSLEFVRFIERATGI